MCLPPHPSVCAHCPRSDRGHRISGLDGSLPRIPPRPPAILPPLSMFLSSFLHPVLFRAHAPTHPTAAPFPPGATPLKRPLLGAVPAHQSSTSPPPPPPPSFLSVTHSRALFKPAECQYLKGCISLSDHHLLSPKAEAQPCVLPALSPRPGVRPTAASAKMGCPAGAQGASRLLPTPELSQPRGNSDSKFSIRFCPWSALQPSRTTLLQATTQCETPFLFCTIYFFLRIQLTSVTQPCPPLCNPWTTPFQASLSFTNSWSLLKLMSIKSVSPPNHLILCHPLLLLPSIFPSIRVFSNESVLIRWPKYWSFSFSFSN